MNMNYGVRQIRSDIESLLEDMAEDVMKECECEHCGESDCDVGPSTRSQIARRYAERIAAELAGKLSLK